MRVDMPMYSVSRRFPPLLAGMIFTAFVGVEVNAAEGDHRQCGAVESRMLAVHAISPPGHGTAIRTEAERESSYFQTDVVRYARGPGLRSAVSPVDMDRYFRQLSFDPLDTTQEKAALHLSTDVRIVRDTRTNIPRVLASNRDAAMFGIGYAHAEDRLWQLDLQRHRFRASLATLLGRGKHDEHIRSDRTWHQKIGYDDADYGVMLRRLRTEHDSWGKRAHEDLESYMRGVNEYVRRVSIDSTPLPLEYRQRGIVPRAWRIEDAVVMIAGLQAIRAAGVREVGNARLLQQLRANLGEPDAMAVYRDLRLAADPEAPVTFDRPAAYRMPRLALESRHVLPDMGSVESFGAEDASAASVLAQPERSYALLVSGARTASGCPMSVQGPQDLAGTPNPENAEIQVRSPDFTVHGVMDFRAPYPVNGARTERFAFSSTAQRADQHDTFVNALCEPDGRAPSRQSLHYEYRGECRRFEIRDVTRRMAGSDESYTLRALRSVHGRVFATATVDGRPVALSQASIYWMREAADYATYARLLTTGQVRSARDFVKIASRLQLSSTFFYIDTRSIAAVDASAIPLRHVSGDFPIEGTGESDWRTSRFRRGSYATVPATAKPWSINPPDGLLVGWNNLPARGVSTSDAPPGAFTYGPVHRVAGLRDPIQHAPDPRAITLQDLLRVQALAAVTDPGSLQLWPIARNLLAASGLPAPVRVAMNRVDRWIAAGASWSDDDGDGFADHGYAALVARAFWPELARRVFEPTLGRQVLAESGEHDVPRNNLPALARAHQTTAMWEGLLHKDLRTLAGQPVRGPLSRPYCGHGDRRRCGEWVTEAFVAAVGQVEDVRYPIIRNDGPFTGMAFPANGSAVPVPTIPWQNRPVFQLIVEATAPSARESDGNTTAPDAR